MKSGQTARRVEASHIFTLLDFVDVNMQSLHRESHPLRSHFLDRTLILV